MWFQLTALAVCARGELWPAAVHLAFWSGAKLLSWPGMWGYFEKYGLPLRAAATLAGGLALWLRMVWTLILAMLSDMIEFILREQRWARDMLPEQSHVDVYRRICALCQSCGKRLLHLYARTRSSKRLAVRWCVAEVNAKLVVVMIMHVWWRSSTRPVWFVGLEVAMAGAAAMGLPGLSSLCVHLAIAYSVLSF